MKGKTGTSMGVVHRGKRRKKTAPMTRGGPVTITRADGTREVVAPYSGPQLDEILSTKKRARRR